MNNQNHQQRLPDWFLKYEKSEIDYLSISTKTFASRVRRILFGINAGVDSRMKVDRSQFNPEDNMGLTTTHFLPALPLFAGSKMDTFDIFDLDRLESLEIQFERSHLISNIRIRDIFLSRLYFNAIRSSFAFPDTLLTKIRNSISENMQAYAARIEAKYNQFNGTPALPLYLKDMGDKIVSLQEFTGNLILLDFWFVGCRFCREELHIQKN